MFFVGLDKQTSTYSELGGNFLSYCDVCTFSWFVVFSVQERENLHGIKGEEKKPLPKGDFDEK